VTIGGIRISHIKIVHAEGKELFIEMPQRSYQMTNGERRYSNIVDLPDDLQRKLEKAILRFWNPQRYAWPNADQDTQAA
jgi:hypothetical protein